MIKLGLQSTLPVQEATLKFEYCYLLHFTSIHASSIGSDIYISICVFSQHNFNPRFQYRKRPLIASADDGLSVTSIHASSIGSDQGNPIYLSIYHELQSTLPVQEATGLFYNIFVILLYFNPRFQYRKRPITFINLTTSSNTSIHASSIGSDKLFNIYIKIL